MMYHSFFIISVDLTIKIQIYAYESQCRKDNMFRKYFQIFISYNTLIDSWSVIICCCYERYTLKAILYKLRILFKYMLIVMVGQFYRKMNQINTLWLC